MGVVYSSEELLTGALPQEGAHLEAANKVIEQIGSLSIAELTVVHGSVVNGNSNIRSDLDVLVTYDSTVLASEPLHARLINEVLGEIGRATSVKIEANVWPAHEPLAVRQLRMYDLLFSRHLERSMKDERWTVGNTDEMIKKIAAESYGDPSALRDVILQYMTYKHGGFSTAPTEFGESERTLAILQRALELPKSIGRKVNQLLGEDRELTPEENWGALAEVSLSTETQYALDMLSDYDEQYTRLIRETCPDDNFPLSFEHIDRYQEWLRGIYPQAIDMGIVATSGFANFIATA